MSEIDTSTAAVEQMAMNWERLCGAERPTCSMLRALASERDALAAQLAEAETVINGDGSCGSNPLVSLGLRACLELQRETIALTEQRAESVEAKLAEVNAERDHERHEKETVADAGQAMVRHLRAQLAEAEAKVRAMTDGELKLGVIELHTAKNAELIKRFYQVRDDLTAAGCIVDLWVMDIATVLGEYGYSLRLFRKAQAAPARAGE